MIEYLKIAIISIITCVFMPLPASASAHLSLLGRVLYAFEDANAAGLYYGIVSMCFSAVVFVYLRRIYIKSFVSIFNKEKYSSQYRDIAARLAVSLALCAPVLIPIGNGRLLLDVFNSYLDSHGALVAAFCCALGSVIMLVSVRYNKKRRGSGKKCADMGDVVRFGLYRVAAFVFPGLSEFSVGASVLLLGNVDGRVVARESLLYLAPASFAVGAARTVRCISLGAAAEPAQAVVCAVCACVASAGIMAAVSRSDSRRLMPFFAVYSIVLTGLILFSAVFMR